MLLTGYLGSGKTTLVNRILANEKGIKFAVIVNDIGEVNIDADLIQQGGVVNKKDDSLVALQNGCICCTLKMDLVEQLNDIVAEQRFDYIVIEASGICEPAPIAQTICSIPTLGPKYIKNGVPQTFRLTGAGWGHGVGLCQIGAAVMGTKGYNYDQILLHYYRGAEIKRIYK